MKRCAVHREKVAYGPEPAQFGHVYHSPEVTAGERPIRPVVLVHGGYWSTDFGLTIETAIARAFAERGAVVWNVEYRRLAGDTSPGDEGAGWPATGRDVIAALQALDGPVPDALPAEVARRTDWNSAAVVGHSAGGQLAVWATARLGARTDRCAITTVVAQSALLDTVRAADRPSVRALMGRDYVDIPQRYADASPLEQPPFPAHVVAIHAAEDRAIPAEMSRHYVRTVSAAGQSAELIVVPGEGHDAFVDPRSVSTRQTVRVLGI
ncbi:hypothetical protein GCM10009624_14960 [Gordonia sinesedis]